MRIIINVKYRRGSVHLETRMDQSSTDKVAEINAGQALFDQINATFAEIQKESDPLTVAKRA